MSGIKALKGIIDNYYKELAELDKAGETDTPRFNEVISGIQLFESILKQAEIAPGSVIICDQKSSMKEKGRIKID